MTKHEVDALCLTVDIDTGKVLDSFGNEYRDENGNVQYQEPIGVIANIKWHDTIAESQCPKYMSFGAYSDDDNEDEFGVPDSVIFYYLEDEDELDRNQFADFLVLSYTPVYAESQI